MADAGRIVVPNFMPAVDDNGTPLPGARLFVYVNRTTTLAVIYADQDMTIPLANPVIADASGQFVPIWQDSALFFSVAFDSFAGQLGTFDDLQPSTNIGGAVDKLDRDGGNPEPTFLENVNAAARALTNTVFSAPSGDDPSNMRGFKERIGVYEIAASEFAADPDGVGPITVVELQTALDYAETNNIDIVRLHPNRWHNITDDLTIPDGVCLKGFSEYQGYVPGSVVDEWVIGSRINLATTATIILSRSAGLTNCAIIRLGMTHAENDADDYAGTAITVAGNDTICRDLYIVGFNRAYLTENFERGTCERIKWDCVNGFKSFNSLDVPRWRDLHGWPFGTIGTALGLPPEEQTARQTFNTGHFLFRNGIAYECLDRGEFMQISNCFCYGYLTGFSVNGPSSQYYINCQVDNITTGAGGGAPYVINGTRGFYLNGPATNEINMIGCLVVAVSIGYDINVTNGVVVDMVDCTAAVIRDRGIQNTGPGMLKVSGGHLRGANGLWGTGGIGVDSQNGTIVISPTTTVEGWLFAASGNNRPGALVGMPTIEDNITFYQTALYTFASGDPFVPSPRHAVQLVTGTADTGNILPTYAGHTVTFVFQSAGVVVFALGATLFMSADFTSNAGSTLTMTCDGTNWYEVSRSVTVI